MLLQPRDLTTKLPVNRVPPRVYAVDSPPTLPPMIMNLSWRELFRFMPRVLYEEGDGVACLRRERKLNMVGIRKPFC